MELTCFPSGVVAFLVQIAGPWAYAQALHHVTASLQESMSCAQELADRI